jgi:hypothetical protein
MQSISTSTFISQFKQIEMGYQRGFKKYLYRDLSGQYLTLQKIGSETKIDQLQRLTFRDIVLNYSHHKDSLSNLSAIESLKRMSMQKLINDDKRNLFIRLAILTIDYGKNYFYGYGMRSSTSLAFQLVEALTKKNTPPLNQTTPTKLSTPQRSYSTVSSMPHTPSSPRSIQERKKLLEQSQISASNSPKKPLEKKPKRKIDFQASRKAYIQDSTHCDHQLKASLFLKMDEEGALDLLRELPEEDKIQFLFDLIKHGNKSVAEEVIKKLDMSLSDISKGFEMLVELEKEESGIQFISILLCFIRKYDEKYLSTSQSNYSTLSATNPAVIAVFCIALDKFHNCDNELLQYLGRLLKKEEFDIHAFIKLVSVFKAKQEVHHNIEAVYESKNMLVTHFKNSLKLQEDFSSHAEYQHLKTYLIQIGALTDKQS